VAVHPGGGVAWMAAVAVVLLLLLVGCRTGQTEDSRPAFRASARLTPPREPTRREKLYRLLKAEGIPTEASIRKLGSGVDSELVDVINNRELESPIRVKAVSCMGYFQNRRAQLQLRSVLTDPTWGKPYRVAALIAIANSMGPGAFEQVKNYARDPDDEMRLACVEALIVIGHHGALNLLKDLQLTEADARVLNAIDNGIRKLGRSRLEGD